MLIKLNIKQAKALARVIAMATVDVQAGARLVDTVGFDRMGHLPAIAEQMGLDEDDLIALHFNMTKSED